MPQTPKTKKPRAPAIGGVPVDDVNEKVSIAMVRMAAQGSVPAARTVLDLIEREQARSLVDAAANPGTGTAALSVRAYLVRELEATHDDLTSARRAGSWQAVAALRRQALSLRSDLETHDRRSGADVDNMTDQQLMAKVVSDSIALPPAIRDQFMETLDALDTGQIVPLKVSGQ